MRIHREARVSNHRVEGYPNGDIDLLDGCEKTGIGIDVDGRDWSGDELLDV